LSGQALVRDMELPKAISSFKSQGQVILEVSTTFFPAAKLPGTGSKLPDTVIYSRDSVFFYCHQTVLKSQSTNHFGQIIPIEDDAAADAPLGAVLAISLGEPASVLNLILLIVYGMPCANYAPSLETIEEALRWLDKYGISIPDESSPTDVWSLVIQHGSAQPIRAYAVAAAHDMHDVCVKISPLTLGTSLDHLSEADALTMGPIYLRSLFFLHLGRRDALKRVIEKQPVLHDGTYSCTASHPAEVLRSWDLAVADVLLYPNQQNLHVEELWRAFAAMLEGPKCEQCVESVRARVEGACADWLTVKQTI